MGYEGELEREREAGQCRGWWVMVKCLDFYPNWGGEAMDTIRITDRKGSSAQNRCLKIVLLVFGKHF